MTSFHLKLLAMVCMALDHANRLLIEPRLTQAGISFWQDLTGPLPDNFLFYLSWAFWLLGRLAFVLFAFLLVEGFLHTRNFKKYLSRLAFFALVSELPFNRLFGTWFNPLRQNVLITFILGLLCLYMIERAKDHPLVALGSCLVFSFVAIWIRCDYSWFGIVLMVIFYWWRKSLVKRNLIAGCLAAYQASACLALIPISFYQGKEGPKMGYWAYAFYPIHILVLVAMSYIV